MRWSRAHPRHLLADLVRAMRSWPRGSKHRRSSCGSWRSRRTRRRSRAAQPPTARWSCSSQATCSMSTPSMVRTDKMVRSLVDVAPGRVRAFEAVRHEALILAWCTNVGHIEAAEERRPAALRALVEFWLFSCWRRRLLASLANKATALSKSVFLSIEWRICRFIDCRQGRAALGKAACAVAAARAAVSGQQERVHPVVRAAGWPRVPPPHVAAAALAGGRSGSRAYIHTATSCCSCARQATCQQFDCPASPTQYVLPGCASHFVSLVVISIINASSLLSQRRLQWRRAS